MTWANVAGFVYLIAGATIAHLMMLYESKWTKKSKLMTGGVRFWAQFFVVLIWPTITLTIVWAQFWSLLIIIRKPKA